MISPVSTTKQVFFRGMRLIKVHLPIYKPARMGLQKKISLGGTKLPCHTDPSAVTSPLCAPITNSAHWAEATEWSGKFAGSLGNWPTVCTRRWPCRGTWETQLTALFSLLKLSQIYLLTAQADAHYEGYLEVVQTHVHMYARLSALHLLCKTMQSCIAPMKKWQKTAQMRGEKIKRCFWSLILLPVTIWCLNVWENRIGPTTKFLAPSVIMLGTASKFTYLLKEEVFSVDRAQTCTDVKPSQKLSRFHLFHIVNHLHLKKKMTGTSNSMKCHWESSHREALVYEC